MNELIAVDLPASHRTVELIEDTWAKGDGFAPVDQRLPLSAKKRLIDALRPSYVIDKNGTSLRLPDALELDEGQRLAMATSGTTGAPKVVMYTQEQIEASVRATANHIGVRDSDHWLCCLPISHIGGMSVILRSILIGNPVEVHHGFDAAEVTAAAERGSTLVSLVPTALKSIDPFIFRKIVLGGSKPPAEIPSNTFVTYGLTETGSGVVYDGQPLEGLEVSIGPGDEVLLRGPMIATSFRDGSAITDSHGWLHTRDAGTLENGRLTVFGRIDEVINTGGEKVYPAALETLLESHPKVSRVAIVAIPDPHWGEAVAAVVIPSASGMQPSLEELRGFVKEHMPAYCAPKILHIWSELPLTSLGKIQKGAIKEKLSQGRDF